MLLILICRKWNFSTVWESLDQIVCKVLLLWRKLKFFWGKGIIVDFVVYYQLHIILQRFGIMIPENKLFWRFGGFHTYSYITTVRCSTPSSTKCGQTEITIPTYTQHFFIYYSTTSITVVFLFKFLLFFLKIVLSFSLLLILNPCDCQQRTLKGEAWKS